ncbi:MAG: hypothetical protein QMD97_01790 [Candidatus Aenigmarchaeota archaeon]|nr:hypothetical protein [Candidatus Aenigmarchaeota archaeon]
MTVNYADFEIIGFDGTPSVYLICSLPVGHKKGADLYFKASHDFHQYGFESPTVGKYMKREIDSFAETGRLTLIPEPIEMIEDAIVVEATKKFLQDADFLDEGMPCGSFNGSPFVWQDIRIDPITFVTCVSEQQSKDMMDYWGIVLSEKCRKMLDAYMTNRKENYLQEAERLVVSALFAARDKALHQSISVQQHDINRYMLNTLE